jgi:hypothetical protein
MKRSWAVSTVGALCLLGSLTAGSSAAAPTFDGVWHGTLSSRNYAAVPVTLIINRKMDVKLTGAVNLISPCLKNADLEVTTEGSTIVLAGSDPDGGTITFRGSIDDGGTQLAMSYILNGSSSGKCETDHGAGTLTKK